MRFGKEEDDMEKKFKKIFCYKCKKDSGYTEEVLIKKELKKDIQCPHCGVVIISAEKDYC